MLPKNFLHCAATAICLSLTGTSAFAATLDQFNDVGGVNFNGGQSVNTWQQKVTAGATGQLDAIEVFFRDTNLGQSVDVSINLGNGWQSDASDYFANLTMNSGWNTIDVSTFGINLVAGDMFSIGLAGTGSGFYPAFTGTTGDAYADGDLYLNGRIYVQGRDMSFRTYVSAVPVPAALPLLGGALGLMGLIGLRRKHA